ncbi:hypothetical protein ACFQBS_20280 [Planomonospora parontospora]|uniref:hypothetical protein n=1 Tax=Planomonospora parontospora TaxID=58119 RepID=UPI00360BE0CA
MYFIEDYLSRNKSTSRSAVIRDALLLLRERDQEEERFVSLTEPRERRTSEPEIPTAPGSRQRPADALYNMDDMQLSMSLEDEYYIAFSEWETVADDGTPDPPK